MPLGENGIDIPVLTAFRLDRTKHSIATNGHYFSGPLTALALNPATYQFTYRFFANHTAETPEGYLDAETLMSFQGVTGEKGNYKWARGQEKIPENVSTHGNTIRLHSLTHITVVPPRHRRRLQHPGLHFRSPFARKSPPRINPNRRKHWPAKYVHWRRC